MTNEERIPTLALGFGVGVMFTSILVTGQVNSLRQELTVHETQAESVMAEAHSLAVDFAALKARISALARGWESEVEMARRGPRVVVPRRLRPDRNPRADTQ